MSDESNQPPPFYFKDISISGDVIRSLDVEAVLGSLDERIIEAYSSPLIAAGNRAVEDDDLASGQAWVLLGYAASMYEDNSDVDEPLKPMIVWANGSSTTALRDFKENHLTPLKEVLSDIADPELRARVGDILWIRKKDHQAARIASAAYLENARAIMDAEHWPRGYQRLERAAQIGSFLGKSSPERQAALAYGLELLDSLASTDPLYLSSRLIELLLSNKATDPLKLAEYAERSAANAESRNDFTVATHYWELARSCRLKGNDTNGARQVEIRAGEAEITIGEQMAGNPALAAEHWYERGILTLQQAGADHERMKKLRKRLQELQAQRMQNLTEVSARVQIDPRLVEHLDKAKGMSFEDAVRFLASNFRFFTKDELKQSVAKSRQDAVFTSLFSNSILRSDGKKDFILPPIPLSGDVDEETLRYHMWHVAGTLNPVPAWVADYVLQIISEEHPWQDGSLQWLLDGNSFIPSGRHEIYERGLRAGFERDFLVASHLLIPQIENSIRFVLNQRGEITSFLRQDGTEDEFPLTKLVTMDAFVEVFGETISFGLRGFLAERSGQNLRNEVSHGLVSYEEFGANTHILLIPIVIRLLLIGKPRTNGPSLE